MKKIVFALFLTISICFGATDHLAEEGDTFKSLSINYFQTDKCVDLLRYVNGQAKGHTLVIPGEYIFIPDEKLCSYILNTKFDEVDRNQKKGRFFAKAGFAPFQISSTNNEKNISASSDIIYTYSDYEIYGAYSTDSYSSTDSLRKVTVKSSVHYADLSYERKNLFGEGLSYIAFSTYKREKEGDIYVTDHAFRVGPLGIKKSWHKFDSWLDDLSLTFIPQYEFLKENVELFNVDTQEDIYKRTYSRFIRASVGASFSFGLDFLGLNINNGLYYRPAYNLKTSEMEFSNADVENTLSFEYSFNDIASLSYENQFTWDTRRKSVKQLPSTEVIHALYLNFSYIR